MIHTYIERTSQKRAAIFVNDSFEVALFARWQHLHRSNNICGDAITCSYWTYNLFILSTNKNRFSQRITITRTYVAFKCIYADSKNMRNGGLQYFFSAMSYSWMPVHALMFSCDMCLLSRVSDYGLMQTIFCLDFYHLIFHGRLMLRFHHTSSRIAVVIIYAFGETITFCLWWGYQITYELWHVRKLFQQDGLLFTLHNCSQYIWAISKRVYCLIIPDVNCTTAFTIRLKALSLIAHLSCPTGV